MKKKNALAKNLKTTSMDELKSFPKRCLKDTPPFFRKVRFFGILLTTIGTSLIAAPITLPVIFDTITGYMIAIGTVITAISQATIIDYDQDKSSK